MKAVADNMDFFEKDEKKLLLVQKRMEVKKIVLKIMEECGEDKVPDEINPEMISDCSSYVKLDRWYKELVEIFARAVES